MNALRVFLVAIAAVFQLAVGGCASPAAPDAQAPDASVVLRGWVDAYNSRDPARIVAQYAPDATLWGTTSPVLRANPAAIADYFKDAAARPSATVRIGSGTVREVSPGLFVAAGIYTFGDASLGPAGDRPSRFSFVLQRRDGRWLIVHHHSSAIPVARQ